MSSARHEWYQTDTKIVVTVLLKNAADKHYTVHIERNRIVMTADDDFKFELNLFGAVNVERSSHKATPSKVEISLFKETGERWESLEKKAQRPAAADAAAAATTALPAIHKKDWESLAKEVEKKDEEEAQSEEALQRLFKKIYSSSSPEVQKAMNKSFSESGGTVLSTNWQEVSKDKVDIKPPEGVEFRKWD